MDKETLLKRRAVDTFDTVLIGDDTVTVRGLSRDEVLIARRLDDDDASDRMTITMALIDPADMTPADVAEWFKSAPAGDTVRVLEKIRDLSGLGEDARKSGVQPAGE